MSQILNIKERQRLCTSADYEKLRHLIVPLLTAISVAIVGDTTWELILHIIALVRFHFMHLIDAQLFHAVFEFRIKPRKKSPHSGSWRASHA